MGTRENWDQVADVWEQHAIATRQEVDPYGIVAMDAVPLDDDTSILDIGCGPGVTTVELAQRAGPATVVTGVDISPRMITHAKQRRRHAIMRGDITPDNIELRVADAEHDDLGTNHDVIFSRFGVMFFDDPKTGFANLANALKTDGWLSVVTWATPDDNPWMPLPTVAAAPVFDVTIDDGPANDPGPFRFADRAATIELLSTVGFNRFDVIDITQPRRVRHGTERHWISLSLRMGPLAAAFESASQDRQNAAIDEVITAMEKYRQPGPTGDWLIPAHAILYVARRA